MHIPDGFLDTKTWVTTVGVSAIFLSYGISRLKREFDYRKVPLMGVVAAFIFAAQMINFPVAGGTSGHLIGALLAAVLAGPLEAMVIMSTILIVQCFVFMDGGVTALGANILNMALIATWVGYYVYRLLDRKNALQPWALFLGSWVSVVAAAVAASIELAVSGTIPLSVVLPAMLFWHLLIGVGEGAITLLVVSYVKKTRPEILFGEG
ncbi:energy-coupling factor ABC transporter permease [Thermatribacter velox]|uniref:Energy-coupling factor ABC transporter permease n=1 Tax=Thermatribacter velox TaxID=3039681 RepID=A0ABZ2YFF6_9BACT